jgi:hypothetical protein
LQKSVRDGLFVDLLFVPSIVGLSPLTQNAKLVRG